MRAATLPIRGDDEAILSPPAVAALGRYAVRLTGDAHAAEDLCQETCLKAWRGRRGLRDPAAAVPWLLRIAANLWRDRLRRRRSTPPSLGDHALAEAPAGDSVDRSEDLQRTLAAMEALPPMQRDAVFLAAVEGMSRGAIAAVLGTSVGAVKANLSIARAKLRAQLEDVVNDL